MSVRYYLSKNEPDLIQKLKLLRDNRGKGRNKQTQTEVDIQGAQTLRKILGNSALFIFLVAESEIATAREEIKHNYVVVNAKGKLDDSVKRVESIIDAEKSKVHQRIVRILWFCSLLSEQLPFTKF